MKFSIMFSIIFIVSSVSIALEKPSLVKASPAAQQAILRELLVVIPTYLVESEKVLETIEKNVVANKITDQTLLSKTKIKNLFAPGQSKLAKVMSEVQFKAGRDEVNVAWLKSSVEQLKKMNKVLAQIYESKTGYKKLNPFFINESYSIDEISEDVSLDIKAVSRPYCNMSVSYSKMEDEVAVIVAESCD